jgi:EAL domain-containing protein (putative c-di-GMP-specific phosphodiesterase class I)
MSSLFSVARLAGAINYYQWRDVAMSSGQDMRRARSARHYLIDDELASRLFTTVVLAARALDFPDAMVNILDSEFQYTISSFGGAGGAVLPRRETFCDTVIRTGAPLAVENAVSEPHFARLRSVGSGEIGTYIGIPLLGRESLIVGTVCVIDPRARSVSADQLDRLGEFGKIVEDQLDLIRRLKEQRQSGVGATTALSRAIRLGEIVPWYQPVIELSTGRTVGYEALARWEHPGGRVDEPDTFVPLAEDSDLIIDLDLAVMRTALRQLELLQRSEPTVRMSVNLSGRHFHHDDWFTGICDVVADSGVAPQDVDLELTETTQIAATFCDGAVVQQLRDHGFRVVLDDFGTGWSTLEYLLRLPASGIKIDRAVTAALGSTIGNALTRAVTGLAGDLGLVTVIEGIETAEQADLARGLGCDLAQGFIWSAPMPAGDLSSAAQVSARSVTPGRRPW